MFLKNRIELKEEFAKKRFDFCFLLNKTKTLHMIYSVLLNLFDRGNVFERLKLFFTCLLRNGLRQWFSTFSNQRPTKTVLNTIRRLI